MIALFRDTPELGRRWLGLRTSIEGRAFFKDTQNSLIAKLKQLGIADIYDHGSHEGVHVRGVQLLRSQYIVEDGSERVLLAFDSDMDFPGLDRFSQDATLVLSAEVHSCTHWETYSPM